MSITILIIIVTAIVSFVAFQNKDLRARLIFYPVSIKDYNQHYRWITSGFVHADTTHLFFNMFALFSFGSNVESIFLQEFGSLGKLYFLILYITAIPLASMYDYFTNKDNPRYAALGASGAVAAIIFASIMYEPLGKIYMYFIPIGIPSVVFGVLYLVYSYYMSQKANDNIGHSAHFYGSVYGVLFTIATNPQVVPHFIHIITNFKNYY